MNRAPASQRIACGELGCSELERWSVPWRPVPEDAAKLELLASQGVIELEVRVGGDVRVAGRDACGRIRLPSGAHVEIASKIELAPLVDWLIFTDTVPELDGWADDPLLGAGGTLVELVVCFFLRELTQLTRFHWRPGYAAVSELTTSIRGNVDARRLARTAGRLPALPCTSRARTMDTIANRVLARALDAASRLAAVSGLPEPSHVELAWLLRMWSDIDRELPGLDQALAEVVSRPPIGYRRATRMARLLLTGGRLDAVHGDGGELFLVKLSVLWEQGLRRIVAAWSRKRGFAPSTDSDRTRHWHDSGSDEAARWLTVDALVRAQRPVVLDAKYKRAYGRESREDRFQMAGYAMAFGALAAVLVYPTAEAEARSRALLRSAMPGALSEIFSMELPMRLGPGPCAAEIAPILDQLCR
jgi:5-methylcytosine-specific restriction endonuclease McrBC regulatory subunit McrC